MTTQRTNEHGDDGSEWAQPSGSVHVVVPAFNEASVVGGVVKELISLGLTVHVVDDGSSDDTAVRAEESGARVLRHVLNRGQGAALQTGIAEALRRGAEIIVTFDADGQHDSADVEALVRPIQDGEVDITLGSRFLEGKSSVPRTRRVVLGLAVLFTRLVSGVALSDAHDGLRAFSRRAASLLDLKLDGMAHASEIIDQIQGTRLRYREVPVHVTYSSYSREKGQHASAAFRIAWDYIVARVFKPD